MKSLVDIEREAVLLREAAQRAGLVPEWDPSRTHSLESADEFVARMRVEEGVTSLTTLVRRSRTKRIFVGAGAIAASLIVFVGVSGTWQSPVAAADTPPILDFEFAAATKIASAPGVPAAATLRELATAAGSSSYSQGRGPVQHIVTDNWFTTDEVTESGAKGTTLTPQLNETYAFPDGSLRLIERQSNPLSPDGRGAPGSGEWEKLPTTLDEMQPSGSSDSMIVDSLSTDPARLRGQLTKLGGCDEADGGPKAGTCLVSQINDLYTHHVIPAKTAAAMWTVLSEVPNLTSLGEVEDRSGRQGIGISLFERSGLDKRWILIISPETGQLLGREVILLQRDADIDFAVPAIVEFTAVLSSQRTAAPKS